MTKLNEDTPSTGELWRNPRFGRRISEIDGLRGTAILLVLVWHYAGITFTPARGSALALVLQPMRIAWSGVDLFFVLSGFLIGGILLDAKTSERYFKPFYARRFHRIFPLYYAWLVTFFVGVAVVGPASPEYLKRLFNLELPPWSYPLYVQNLFMTVRQTFGGDWLAITWSLAVEEQFYLVLPFAIRYLRVRTLIVVVAIAVVAAPILRVALHSTNPFYGPYTLLPCRADALGCGVLAAIAARHERIWAWTRANIRLVWCAFAVLGLGVAYLSFHYQGRLMNSVGYSWMALFYTAALVIAVVSPGAVVKAVLDSRPLQELGIVAYGVYMFHVGANALLHAVFFGAAPVLDGGWTAGATALAAAATFVLAKLSWRYFEKPFVARGHVKFPY